MDSLEAFVVFSQTLNFTHAAAQLHISQPALHVKIRKLSEELGVPLYVRKGRQLSLTPQGKELERFGRETRQHVDGFVEQLVHGSESQSVTLAAGAGCYLYLLGNSIRQFRKESKVPLELITADRPRTIDLITSGQAHLGVTVLTTIPEGIEAQLIASVPTVLAIAESHRYSRRRSLAIKDLQGEELIVPSANKPHRTTIEQLLEAHGISWNIALETSGWELMLHFVKLGLGASIISGCCQVPKTLKAIPIRDFPETRYYLLHRRSIHFTKAQQLLSELIQQTG